MRFSLNTSLKTLVVTLCVLLTSSLAFADVSLEQGAWVNNQTYYQMGHNSIPNIQVTGAPEDTDWNRSAMLHDGKIYRLYFFKQKTADTLYQFGFNPRTRKYEYGYQSIPVLKITGIPKGANTARIAMLHDGTDYRLYMLGKGKKRFTLHQFAFNRSTNNYEYGYRSIKTMPIVNMPKDSNIKRWAMLHDGKEYRLYFGKKNTQSMYQAAFNRSNNSYVWKHNSIPEMQMKGFKSAPVDFLMLHDRNAYRFYYLQGVRKGKGKGKKVVTAVKAVKGERCPKGWKYATYEWAQANQQRACRAPGMGQWHIVRLAKGGSQDGWGYKCGSRKKDKRKLGGALCVQYGKAPAGTTSTTAK